MSWKNPVRMNSQLPRLDSLLAAGIGNQPFGQLRALPVGDHPADHIAAENVEDHVKIEVRPLSGPTPRGLPGALPETKCDAPDRISKG